METCKRCASFGRTEPAEITAYWGDPLCRDCARHIAKLLDERDKWPRVTWGDDEDVLLNG